MHRSTDFVNMETPPRPKESPYLSYMDDSSRPFPMRRRSTNYINTLRDKGFEVPDIKDVPPLEQDLPMNSQDNKHESTKYYMKGNPQMPLEFDNTVNMGDSIDYGDKHRYRDEAVDPLQQRNPLERRPSFQYEDFKKDIYEKLHILR